MESSTEGPAAEFWVKRRMRSTVDTAYEFTAEMIPLPKRPPSMPI